MTIACIGVDKEREKNKQIGGWRIIIIIIERSAFIEMYLMQALCVHCTYTVFCSFNGGMERKVLNFQKKMSRYCSTTRMVGCMVNPPSAFLSMMAMCVHGSVCRCVCVCVCDGKRHTDVQFEHFTSKQTKKTKKKQCAHIRCATNHIKKRCEHFRFSFYVLLHTFN